MKKMSWYGISDDYGVVGTGWDCPYCEEEHNWVFFNDLEDVVACDNCGKESIVAEEMD